MLRIHGHCDPVQVEAGQKVTGAPKGLAVQRDHPASVHLVAARPPECPQGAVQLFGVHVLANPAKGGLIRCRGAGGPEHCQHLRADICAPSPIAAKERAHAGDRPDRQARQRSQRVAHPARVPRVRNRPQYLHQVLLAGRLVPVTGVGEASADMPF